MKNLPMKIKVTIKTNKNGPWCWKVVIEGKAVLFGKADTFNLAAYDANAAICSYLGEQLSKKLGLNTSSEDKDISL